MKKPPALCPLHFVDLPAVRDQLRVGQIKSGCGIRVACSLGDMAAIEKSTNQVFRRKYFIDGNQVLLSGAKAPKKPRSKAVTAVLAANQVAVSNIPVQLTPEMQKMGDHIRVDVVKEGDRIKKIKISCPCGRTADLDCEYSKP